MVPDAPDLSQVKIQNELLCFCVNKSRTLPFESILKICTEFYSGELIQGAKELLWESAISAIFPARKDLRLIKRKSTSAGSKERADLEDILKALQACDREGVALPQFFALDLSKIPASPEHVNVSALLTQIRIMQDELHGVKQAVQSLQEKPKTPKAEATWASVASAPPPSQAEPAEQQPSQPVHAETAKGQAKSPQPGSQQLRGEQSAVHQPVDRLRQQVDELGFTLVSKHKNKNRKRLEVKGSSSSTLLRGVAAPPKTVDLFVGRLDLSTTPAAVELHTNWLVKDGGKVSVEEIPHCAEAYGYKGFKISVPAESMDRVLQPGGWPTHVSVKRFYRPRGGKVSKGAAPNASGAKPLTRCASVGSVAIPM